MKDPFLLSGISRSFLLLFLLAGIAGNSAQAQDSTRTRPEFAPEIFGILKTKVEYDLDNSLVRFEVRNARFGVLGKMSDYMSYKIEIDLSDEGKMKMLDAWVKFAPVKNLGFYLGQRKIPFSSDYMRNPAENIFANRSFLAKYINDGMRDIGFYAEYDIPRRIPVRIVVGAVNGTGNNNPQWITRPNLVTRVSAGGGEGFRATGNFYYGEETYEHNLVMIGAELRYGTGNFFIETEYISRNWDDTLSVRQKDDGLYIHSFYNFIPGSRMITMLTPTARFDVIGRSVLSGDTEASRFSCGLNVGFDTKQFYSEIRLNYENYFRSLLPIHTDKLTLEFIGRF
ncbi:MAG: porin [Bacteroidales bacterium]